jgi:bifunctional non-homologous end joining protein LigD
MKHDGFRFIARKTDKRVELYSRPGNDLTVRFPLVAAAIARLRPRSCIIDDEAVACGADGIACFEMIRRWDANETVFMWGFDLLKLNGADLRRKTRAGAGTFPVLRVQRTI